MKPDKEKMTIILFSGDMDRSIAAFTLATTAAAAGTEVSIFFTFWGLNLLKKSLFTLGKSQSILQKIFNIFSNSNLPVSRMNMCGLGPIMMKYLMKKSRAASLNDLMSLAKQLKVKYIACTTSCSILGLSKENLLDCIDEFAGAATYLNEARESKINLFI